MKQRDDRAIERGERQREAERQREERYKKGWLESRRVLKQAERDGEERDRETERQRDRETERQRDRETERQKGSRTHTHMHTCTHAHRQTEPTRAQVSHGK
jgi:hypothetical protein